MGRRFVTAEDIDELAAAGRSHLEVDARTTLTDLARERAHDRGVTIVEVERAAAATDHGGPIVIGTRDLPRRQLRAAVRSAVVAELGTAPDGLDAAIGRVLDRFGVTDISD